MSHKLEQKGPERDYQMLRLRLLYQEWDLSATNINSRAVKFGMEILKACWLVRNQPNWCTVHLIKIESTAIQFLYRLIALIFYAFVLTNLHPFLMFFSVKIVPRCFSIEGAFHPLPTNYLQCFCSSQHFFFFQAAFYNWQFLTKMKTAR